MNTVFSPETVWTSPGPTFNATHKAKFISVHPFTAIAVAFLGTDTDNDTAVVEIIGYMFPDSKNGPGPGIQLWKATVLLGSTQYAGDIPHPAWASGDYHTVDDVTVTVDVASATFTESAASSTGILLLPTLGFSHLMLQFTDVGGAGAESVSMGCLWKGISKEGVL